MAGARGLSPRSPGPLAVIRPCWCSSRQTPAIGNAWASLPVPNNKAVPTAQIVGRSRPETTGFLPGVAKCQLDPVSGSMFDAVESGFPALETADGPTHWTAAQGAAKGYRPAGNSIDPSPSTPETRQWRDPLRRSSDWLTEHLLRRRRQANQGPQPGFRAGATGPNRKFLPGARADGFQRAMRT